MPQAVTAVDPALPTVTGTVPADLATPHPDPLDELDRQVETLVASGVAAVAGLAPEALRETVAPLRTALPDAVARPSGAASPDDHVPFVLVVPADANDLTPAMRLRGRQGVSVLGRDEAPAYRPLPDVAVPEGPAYLLLDVDTGSDLRGEAPATALEVVRGRGRTPLTLAEGIALVTVRPDMLRPNRCFSLLASRDGSKRVPAVWISERRPKLGWCWDGNPHTWLGSASAAGRLGADG